MPEPGRRGKHVLGPHAPAVRRRRGPGHDWAILKLGAVGTIGRVEIDTNHFKGNFPDTCTLEACNAPYAEGLERIPTSLGEALEALQADSSLTASLSADFVHYFCQIKRSEIQRHAEAADPQAFERCEYFARS